MTKHPRINCCIDGCKRGTTRVEPGCLIICGKCWRKAPKELREKRTACLRLARRYQARNDFREANVFELRADRIWSMIRDLLNGDEPEAAPGPGLPPLMAEELRKLGLA